jgi:hypothetical protein
MPTPARSYVPREVEIEGLGRVLFMVDAGRAVYVPIRPVCVSLGIDPRSQLARIQNDEHYENAIAQIRVPSAGGDQETLCLRSSEAAWWLVSISPRKLPKALQGRMEDVRNKLLMVADRLVFGDLSDVARDVPLRIAAPMHGELTFGCPRCGAPLCFVVDGTEIHLRIDR